MTFLPPPSAYGLPERYDSWREHQPEAVLSVCDPSSKPVAAIVAPTGFGKTITGAAIAKLLGGRCCYTVETKLLMHQIEEDMPNVFFKVWGKNNYDCRLLMENGFRGWQARCDKAEALCRSCAYKDNGCDYYDSVRKAGRMESVLTNYSFWLAINRHTEEGIGYFDTIIMDEAHSAVDTLTKSMRVELDSRECEKLLREDLPAKMPIPEWSDWARKRLPGMQTRLDGLKYAGAVSGGDHRELREVETIVRKLEVIARVDDNWVEDRDWKEPGSKTAFEPVWPAPYRHQLFRPAHKIVLMSATIRPKTLELLGLQPDEYDFLEYPSSFPVARRPVIYIPGANQRKTMNWDEKMAAIEKIDQIIGRRLDRKGAIHTVSFERANLIREHSRYARQMIFTRSGGECLAEDLEQFRRAPMGTVLVGPNFDEGVDLAYEQCEYQILMKVPFPDRRSPVVDARCKSDPEYGNYSAMIKIVQMAGRGMRAADDLCETIIIDDAWGNYFLRNNNRFAPKWFLQACRREQYVPKPPEKLTMGREEVG